jgi:D-alanyl-D-alanine carboxypeptidase/D-alanyl-D-alanine-endopeptidase (penicillin-binding protein 4)
MGTGRGGRRTRQMRGRRRVAGVTAIALAALTAMTTGASAARTSAAGPGPISPLQSAWLSALAEKPIQHAMIGAYAYDVTTGKTLAAIHPDWLLTPGSVNKLYASATALADIGSRFRLVTRVEQARSGGPLYLVGDGDGLGDPLYSPPGQPEAPNQLRQLAESVARKVHSAAGVVGVSSLFTGWQAGPGWDVSEVPSSGDPLVSALSADFDSVFVAVNPAAAAGRRPVVRLDATDPEWLVPGYFKIEDEATTGPRGSASTLYINSVIGTRTVVITGSIPVGSSRNWGYLSIDDPALFAADLFARYLKQDGVRLTAPDKTGRLPAHSSEVAAKQDPQNLNAYLTEQNSWSINEMAENLYRLDGVAYRGSGSPAASQAAVNAYLAKAHLSRHRVQVDGSGLSVLDEVSARQVVQLLAYAAHQSYFTEFEHSLIHIGRTSQCTFMCGIMDHTAADGTVWLKTGNLANQWNYAGYARAKNGNLIAFTLFFDGLNENNPLGESLGAIDQMTVDAASWPHEPKPESAAKQRAQLAALAADTGDLPRSVTDKLPASVTAAVRRNYATGEEVSAAVAAVPTGKLVAQSNGQTELQGGLLARLATVSTALSDASKLQLSGPTLSATGPVSGGDLHGNLVLNGNSDPLLSAQQLTALARSVAAQGITSITGHLDYVAADAGQQFGIPNLPFSTPYEDIGAAFAAPRSPLTVNDDQVAIFVRGTAPGQPAQVAVGPAGAPVTLTGAVRTTSGGAGSASAAYVPGTHSYRLSGSVRPGGVTQMTVAPPYPGLVGAGEFAAALRQAGVSVPGAPVAVPASSGTALASLPPPAPAAEALVALNNPSDVAPFDLYNQLGPNSDSEIAARIGSYDQVIDPSGNAAADFLTADSIAQLLASLHASPQAWPVTSELSRPWIVRLPERTTIAGYARTAGGQLVAYTVIINGQLYQPDPDSASRYEPRIGSYCPGARRSCG